MKRLFKDDNIDRSNLVTLADGSGMWVAPSSLEKHGLKNGQMLTKEQQAASLTWKLAREWMDYVAECNGDKL